MSKIPISTQTFESGNILKVVVGTNYPCGGDAGHGGLTLFRLNGFGSTNMSVRVNGGELQEAESVDLVFGGDTECETFVQSLEYALSVLRTQMQAGRYASAYEEIE